jgi:hypothetical protein
MMHLQANLMRQCPSLLYHLSSFHTPPPWNWGKTLKIVYENESTKEKERPKSSEALPLPLNKFSVIPCMLPCNGGLNPLSLCLYRGFNSGLVGMGKMFSNHPFVQTRGVPAIGWDGERCFQTVH